MFDMLIDVARPVLNAVPSAIARASAAVKRGVFGVRLAVPPEAFVCALLAFAVCRLAACFSLLLALAAAARLAFVN